MHQDLSHRNKVWCSHDSWWLNQERVKGNHLQPLEHAQTRTKSKVGISQFEGVWGRAYASDPAAVKIWESYVSGVPVEVCSGLLASLLLEIIRNRYVCA